MKFKKGDKVVLISSEKSMLIYPIGSDLEILDENLGTSKKGKLLKIDLVKKTGKYGPGFCYEDEIEFLSKLHKVLE